jgi:hypothetical protein
MNKQKLLRILNPVLALDFIALGLSALFNDVIPRRIYNQVHPVLGYVFLGLIVLHVFLNWSWVVQQFKKKK